MPNKNITCVENYQSPMAKVKIFLSKIIEKAFRKIAECLLFKSGFCKRLPNEDG